MWCNNCNIETNDSICPLCGAQTIEDLPVEIYWCDHCHTPIIQTASQADKGTCPLCKGKTKYMTADLRPVFPEERLLVELLLKKNRISILRTRYGQATIVITLMANLFQFLTGYTKMLTLIKSQSCCISTRVRIHTSFLISTWRPSSRLTVTG